MAGGGHGAASPEDPSGECGSGAWRRIYDRVEALLPQVEKLAGDRARLEEIAELSEAREKSLHARLLQAEASRMRWKTAYIELPLLANPKIIELQEIDLKDCTPCEDANNLKKAGTSVQPRQSNEDHEGIAGDLRSELTKLKKAYKTVCSHKDTEISGLVGVKDFLCNQLRTTEKENMALLKIKEAEVAEASEATQELQRNIEGMQVAAQKLQQDIKEMQVAAQCKDTQISRSRAEAVNAKKRALILDGKLLDMHSLVKEKTDEIQKLKDLRSMEKDKAALLKIKEVEGAQATEATHKLQKNVEELQVPARNKDDAITRLQAEALAARNKLHSLAKEKDIQKLKDGNLMKPNQD